MLSISTIQRSTIDIYPALIAGLKIEFACDDIDVLAAHFLDAEAEDFHWDARISERHLGQYEHADEEDAELERIAIIGFMSGRWHTALCIVDGDGRLFDMHDLEHFEQLSAAQRAFVSAR